MSLTKQEVARAYERMGHLVLRRCRWILGDAAEADDALQEVFVRLMRYGDGIRAAQSPLGFVYRVTDRVCFDQLARRRTARARSLTLDVDLVADGVCPGKLVTDQDAAQKLLRGFNHEARELLLLYYVDELTQREIAEQLGCSRKTVVKRLGVIKSRVAAMRARMQGVPT